MGIERVQTSWSWSGIGLDGARTHRQCHLLAGIDGRTGQLRMTNRVFINKSGWTTNPKKRRKRNRKFQTPHAQAPTDEQNEGRGEIKRTDNVSSVMRNIRVRSGEREKRVSVTFPDLLSFSLMHTHVLIRLEAMCSVATCAHLLRATAGSEGNDE